jgi:hypothetical protein
MSGYSAYVSRMCAVHTYSTDYHGANARASVQDGQCVQCTLTGTYSTRCGRSNARASVQDGKEWIFRICTIYVCSPQIPLVVVASMHAHPSRTETSEYIARASCICAVHNIPLVGDASMRPCPSRTENECTAPSTRHIPLVIVASMRARPSRTEMSGYSAQISCMCAVHAFHWLGSLRCTCICPG